MLTINYLKYLQDMKITQLRKSAKSFISSKCRWKIAVSSTSLEETEEPEWRQRAQEELQEKSEWRQRDIQALR